MMQMIGKRDVVVFDFDGVIVAESEYFKDEAWDMVFTRYIGRYEVFLKEAQKKFGAGRGGDRRDIVRYVYEKLGVRYLESMLVESERKFDEHVQKRIWTAGTASRARETFTTLASDGISLYINSGTEERALKRSVTNLEIGRFFAGVFGGPASKVENLWSIARLSNVEPREMLFVGDGDGDAEAASAFGCPFVGVANRRNGWQRFQESFPIIWTLDEVLRI